MEILSNSTQIYIDTFSGFIHSFLQWGQMIFFSLLAVNLCWLSLWYAFDKESIIHGMSAFIKKFFVMMLFYTIMNHPNWLVSLLKTSETMGHSLTGMAIDPSSIISNGIAVANKMILPISFSSLLTVGAGVVVALVVYGIILFCFIAIAVDLSVTLILCNALIVVASFFLGFAALNATSSIARQMLDVILANCVKLLGIYLVVAAGSRSISLIANNIPVSVVSFDAYAWITATSVLFWQIAKHLPNQMARIVSGAVNEHHGSELTALAMMAPRYAQTASTATKIATTVGGGLAKTAGSIGNNAAVRMMGYSGSSVGGGLMRAASGTAVDATKAGFGKVSDHFKNMLNKSSGGPGISGGNQAIPGFSDRMYQSTQDFKARAEQHKSTSKPNQL